MRRAARSVLAEEAGAAPARASLPHPALRAHVSRYVQVALDLAPGETLRHPLSALPGSVAAVVWSGQVTRTR